MVEAAVTEEVVVGELRRVANAPAMLLLIAIRVAGFFQGRMPYSIANAAPA